MTAKKRKITLFLSVIFVCFILFTAVFIAAEAEHDCIGHDCPICCAVSAAINTLAAVGAAAAVCMSAFFGAYIMAALMCAASFARGFSTLITLKVKLSN